MKSVVQGAIEHADVPFTQVVQAARVPRSSAYTPIFQTMMTLQGAYFGARNVDAGMSLDRLQVESMTVRTLALSALCTYAELPSSCVHTKHAAQGKGLRGGG